MINGPGSRVLKKLISIIAIGFLATVSARATSYAADKSFPITIPVYEWEPYSGQALRGYGLATEIAADALTQKGYKVTHAFVPWKRALEVAKRGEYEVIPGMWFSEERSESFHFSLPMLSNELVTITVNFDGSPQPGFDAPQGLKGKRVGLVRGYHYPDSLLKLPGVRFEEGVSLGTNLKKLFYRRVDVVVGDRVAGGWLGRRLFGEAADLLEVTGQPIIKRDLYIGVSKNSNRHAAILTAIDEELRRLKSDGRLAERIRGYVDAARPELNNSMQDMLITDQKPE